MTDLSFIACQPRSGSTLLQKMLGTHPAVHTTGETWLMLPPIYMLRGEGFQAEYGAELANKAIKSFWDSLPEGKSDYINELKRMHENIYKKALKGSGANIFLDKTPRYYLILQELNQIFPGARFILLLRNPLAVLCSILRTWVGGNWLKLADFRRDLFEAPRLLLAAQHYLKQAACVVRYEDLVRKPAAQLSRLCDHLGVDFRNDMIEYGDENTEVWRYGDHESVYEHRRPKTSSLHKWSHPKDAQEWRLLRQYADALGKDTFDQLGFDFDYAVRKLEAVRPDAAKLRYTVSLDWIMQTADKAQGPWRRYGLELLDAMREGGIIKTILHSKNRLSELL